MSILVVDENSVFLDMIFRILNNEGYKIITTANGKEGMRIIKARLKSIL